MTVRFSRDRLILYVCITVGYLIHWIHDDLTSNPEGFTVSLINNAWQVIFVVAINILYFEYVLPSVTSAKNNKLILVVASIAAHLVIFAIGLFAWWSLGMLLNIYVPFRPYTDMGKALSHSARYVPGPFLVFAVSKLFFDYVQLKYEGQQARLEKKQAELLFLKSQINPHFLFNTLNNIYSLSQYQPQLVSESVLRLSKILRYLLYETGNEFITIDKEIKIMTDYVDLERLRYNETVSIQIQNDIDDFSEMIPPLLLMPLVENAFKHGISQSRGKRFVDVKCLLHKKTLNFVVRNSVASAASNYEETKDNIGLSNLRRRLDLLYKDFDLVIEQKDSMFTVALKINLGSHV
jgi:two-component system LytT family sensor kinase